MSDSDSDSDDQGAQVRVSLRLANSVQDRSLEVPTEPIAVPADIGRKGLSAVLNHLLGRSIAKGDDDEDGSDSDDDMSDKESLPPLTFEFIVKGTNNRLLRKGVEKEARQHGLSLEDAITITYFPAANVPQRQDDEETLPDWVSCLSASTDGNSDIVLSGCYDGSIHAYRRNADNNTLAEIDFTGDGSVGPIKSMATSRFEDKVWIAAASIDHSLNIHTFQAGDNGKGKLRLHGLCVLAENEVGALSSGFTSLAFNTSNVLASGNGNGRISLWNVQNVVENHTTGTDKKRQKGSSSKKVKPTTSYKPEIAATVHFENAHSQSVTGLSWGNHHKLHSDNNDAAGTHLISGSWDHSIKLWDVEKQNCLVTLNGARVVTCLDTSYHSEGVVATGHPDCTIRLWDVRANGSNQNTVLISDNTFRPSHKAWVSSVQWSRSNAYQLASTSHDGSIKVWDIRSSNPLHTVKAFAKEEKGLSLLWLPATEDTTSQAIYAGGTDCIIKRLEL
jgi:ribosome biogenesis protein YTM1